MSKRRKDTRAKQVDDVRTIEQPKPRQFTPRPCTMCTALRDAESYSFVYHTRGSVRYCKCGFCGNTWKQSENCTSVVVQLEEKTVHSADAVQYLEHGISSISTSTD